MGVRGLTSYIEQSHRNCLIDFRLQDTLLVIDGNSIIFGLFSACNFSTCFGGDYAEFEYYVCEFFDDMLKCNITPLVIFDGAIEDKKLETLYKRSRRKIIMASKSTPYHEQLILPPLIIEVFDYIMQKMNIKCATSLYEADCHIASIARILNCPVLSNDSDFFIFDVMYIPFHTLKQGICMTLNGNGFFKNCKMFKHEYLLKQFPGINRKILPLFAVLLGNDYVKTDVFKKFFSTLKVLRTIENELEKSKTYLKIEALFLWIKNYTLDEAVARVLNKVDSEKYESTLEIIEIIINGYLTISSEILKPLGYSSDEIDALMQNIASESYKFDNLSIFEMTDEIETYDEIDLDSDKYLDDSFLDEDNNISVQSGVSNLNDIVPSWFIEKYQARHFPSFFMDLINRQFFFTGHQMEDSNYPTCINISLKICRVIFQLLNNGTTNLNTLMYFARGKGTSFVKYEMDCKDFDRCSQIPTLHQLIDLPFINRKIILVNTLGVRDVLVAQFPPLWRMYIIAIKYWIVEADKIFTTKYHLYALIFPIIFNVVEKVIACSSYFETNLSKIDNKCNSNRNHNFSDKISVKQALENVKENECIFAKRFFLSKMRTNRDQFDITVVHAFSLFQNCLKFSMQLNALLGHPYPKINVAEFFSGTLIYNLYNDFKNDNDLNQRINDIFKKSPSVLELFISMSTTIEAMLR